MHIIHPTALTNVEKLLEGKKTLPTQHSVSSKQLHKHQRFYYELWDIFFLEWAKGDSSQGSWVRSCILLKALRQPHPVYEIHTASLLGLHFSGWEGKRKLWHICLQAESTYLDYFTWVSLLGCFPTTVNTSTGRSRPKDNEVGGNHTVVLTLQNTDTLLLKSGAECTVKDQAGLFCRPSAPSPQQWCSATRPAQGTGGPRQSPVTQAVQPALMLTFHSPGAKAGVPSLFLSIIKIGLVIGKRKKEKWHL